MNVGALAFVQYRRYKHLATACLARGPLERCSPRPTLLLDDVVSELRARGVRDLALCGGAFGRVSSSNSRIYAIRPPPWASSCSRCLRRREQCWRQNSLHAASSLCLKNCHGALIVGVWGWLPSDTIHHRLPRSSIPPSTLSPSSLERPVPQMSDVKRAGSPPEETML